MDNFESAALLAIGILALLPTQQHSRLFHSNSSCAIERYNLSGDPSTHTGVVERFFLWDAKSMTIQNPNFGDHHQSRPRLIEVIKYAPKQPTVDEAKILPGERAQRGQAGQRQRPETHAHFQKHEQDGAYTVWEDGGWGATLPRYFVETQRAGEFVEVNHGSGYLRHGKLEIKASILLKCQCSGDAQWEVNVLG